METIRNLVQASRKQMTMPCSNSLPSVSVESKAWLTKWKDPSDIERVFSPTNWAYVAQNPEKAYFSNCPTIKKYDEVYGEGNAEMWIYAQVLALFGSSSCKDEGVAQGIGIFAQTFASSVQIYKLSELMLFFSRYKSGRYDNSFSQFDARRIGNAFFKEFIPERQKEIDRCEKRKINEEALARRELPAGYTIPKGYNPYTWYLETKRRAANGDKEAIEKLKYPQVRFT